MPRFGFVVSGRVQGVAFRAHAAAAAQRLGIVGFVRNRSDGTVEVEAEGDGQQLAEFFTWLQRGPAWARVDRVDRTSLAELRTETGFEVRR